jgi:hypothetical protein
MKRSAFIIVIVFVFSCVVCGAVSLERVNSTSLSRISNYNLKQQRINIDPVVHNADNWIIHGKVLDNSGRGLSDLNVAAYDKDPGRDERLGFAVTDEIGRFSINYTKQSFKNTSGERAPDIYLKVFNNTGTAIYNSKAQVRTNAGQCEYFDIQVNTGKRYKKNKF